MDLNDDLLEELECGICMEEYKEPKTLPCIHSFCRICIARHIISLRQEHEKQKGFLCPLCRFFVRIPRPDRPLEQWANQLPNNTQIPKFLESLKKRGNTKCKFHPEENVTSYCKTCNCVVCTKCLRERHPSCTGDSFAPLRDIAAKKKADVSNIVREIDIEAKRMLDNVDLVKSVMSGLKDAESVLVREIRSHAELALKTVTKEEAENLDKLDQAVDEQLKQLRLCKNPMDEAADVLKHYRDEMDSLLMSSTGLDFMDNLETAKERHKECMEMIQRLQNQCRPPTITLVDSESSDRPTIGQLVSSSPLDNISFSESPNTTMDTVGRSQEVTSNSPEAHKTYM